MSTNPFELTFSLRQHTPIIHFQHHQDGATLRATEVKPKLDRFLIERMGGIDKVPKDWFIGDGKNGHALDYKIKFTLLRSDEWTDYIEQPKYENERTRTNFLQNERDLNKTKTGTYPAYFANMGKNYNEPETLKNFEYNKLIQCTIHSYHTDLIDKLSEKVKEVENVPLRAFFAQHNFGSRSGKGFGSFLINNVPFPLTGYTHVFEILELPNETNHRSRFEYIFKHIDLFYRVLRAGINLKNSPDLYAKSALFLYFQSKNIQWEKKEIKKTFFLNDKLKRDGSLDYKGLTTQKSDRHESEALHYSNPSFHLVRDLLGFSPDESWHSYKATISKKEAIQDAHGNWIEKNKDAIERWASPIFFKPVIKTSSIVNDSCKVYIRLNNNNLFTNKHFLINKRLPISTPTTFSLDDYFNFLVTQFNINNHLEGDLDSKEAEIIKQVFRSLTKR